LGGTHNLQQAYLSAIGLSSAFVHVEVGSAVREDPAIGVRGVAHAVMDALRPFVRKPDGTSLPI